MANAPEDPDTPSEPKPPPNQWKNAPIPKGVEHDPFIGLGQKDPFGHQPNDKTMRG